jgi:hypothetical protein
MSIDFGFIGTITSDKEKGDIKKKRTGYFFHLSSVSPFSILFPFLKEDDNGKNKSLVTP